MKPLRNIMKESMKEGDWYSWQMEQLLYFNSIGAVYYLYTIEDVVDVDVLMFAGNNYYII